MEANGDGRVKCATESETIQDLNNSVPYPFEELCEALESQLVVRVRAIGISESLPGKIVSVSENVVLFEIVDSGVRFDGYVAVALDEIWEVDSPYEYHEFVQAALDSRNMKSRPVDVPVDSWRTLIEATRERFPIARFWAPDVYLDDDRYGFVVAIDDQHVRFRPITRNGVWGEHDEILSLEKLVRLDFGGDIETMLSALTIDLGI